MKQQPFSASQFTATKFDTAEDKAKWCNQMAAWIQRGFPEQGFTKRLYNGLYLHLFSHIAHYNQAGFYQTWFSDVHAQHRWIDQAIARGERAVGDPQYTWSDVETAFSAWLEEQGLWQTYADRCSQDIERRERAQLALLQAKYGTAAAAAAAAEKGKIA